MRKFAYGKAYNVLDYKKLVLQEIVCVVGDENRSDIKYGHVSTSTHVLSDQHFHVNILFVLRNQ